MLPLTYLAYLNRSKIIHINGGEVTFGAIDDQLDIQLLNFQAIILLQMKRIKKKNSDGQDPSRYLILVSKRRHIKKPNF